MLGIRTTTIVGVALLAWITWIVLATSHDERIERTCQPTLWLGNITTSLVALTVPDYQDQVERAFDSIDYACRYTVWRLIYEDDYLKGTEGQEGGATGSLQ